MEKLKVLFLCTGNSCRSQMAEGLARHFRAGDIEPYSAGIQTHGLNPWAEKVMKEIGIDISHQSSQHLDEFENVSFNLVITVCSHAHESCPFFSGDCKVIHIGFDDPPKMAEQVASKGGDKEEQLNCYRRIRDEIADFIRGFDFKKNTRKK